MLAIIAAFACAGSAPAQTLYDPLVIVTPAPPAIRAAEARELVADVNNVRAEQGLTPVAVDAVLAQAALAYANDMARRRFFGHVTPDGSALPDRLAKAGFHWTVAAENIALDEDVRHADAALRGSPTHRANILDPRVRKIGVAALSVGVGATLYVEEFAL